uniref:Kinesin-like protein n=1 Tax=Strongyloides papillosus TaxID=174720 RepID=A0A0N5C0P1_STREA
MSSLFATSSISYGKGGKSCIKVGIRVRPRNSKEVSENDQSVLRSVGTSIMLNDSGKERKFTGYDFVLDESVTQCQLYKKMVAEYIPQLLSGYNCTIFAYGQTGTGKTFTMEGECKELNVDGSFKWDSDNGAGVTSRAMQHIFTMLEIPTCTRKSITVTYVELYNEEVYDLLGDDISKKLKIFDDTQNAGGICIKDVNERVVDSMLDVHQLIRHGASMRQTASTAMNQRSSRSHAVFTAVVEWDELIGNEKITRRGKINLVDLAGSENIGKSGATKGSAREAGNINTSLLALGQVINALTEKSSHIPYRSSKLTRILKDSLGGSALTCLIAAVSPTMSNRSETISTLEYGLKAMNVENDIRANIRARKEQLFQSLGIMDDYLQGIGGYLRDHTSTVSRAKLLSLADKVLFSKVDSIVSRRGEIAEEANIWYTANTESLDNLKQQFDELSKALQEREFEAMKEKFKLELLEDEIREKSDEIERIKGKSLESIKVVQNRKNDLSSKADTFKEKCSEAIELLKRRQDFLGRHSQKCQDLVAKCDAFEEEVTTKMGSELKKLQEESRSEYDSILEKNVSEIKENIGTANSLFDSVKTEKESITDAVKSQDELMESFKENKNQFSANFGNKLQEFKEIQNFNEKIRSTCEEKINENNTVSEEIELINVYAQEMKTLVKAPEKSETVVELEKYLSSIENVIGKIMS